MSENSDSGSDDVRSGFMNGSDQDDICRDYLRNVCRRGKRCKYRHPISEENDFDMGSSSKPEPTFCHDFQNMGCHRPTCKFLHCTREEEEHYHQTGQLPPRMQPHFGPGGNNSSNSNNHADIPLCRDYMKGECKRGSKCKYRHISHDYPDCDPPLPPRSDLGGGGPGRLEMPRHDLRPDLRPPPPHSSDLRNNHGFNNFEENYDKYERYEYIHGGPNHGAPSEGPSLKRRRLDVEGYGGGGNGYDSRYGSGPASSSSSSRPPVSYQFQVLEEENTALRRRVEELKKQVADLTATNEVLLEQNARLRVAKATTVSAVQMPVTQTLAPAGTLNLATMAPAPAAMQATALGTHLSTNLTQQIALNSDMATQHALHSAAQRMAREMQQHQQVAAAAAAPPAPPAGAATHGAGGRAPAPEPQRDPEPAPGLAAHAPEQPGGGVPPFPRHPRPPAAGARGQHGAEPGPPQQPPGVLPHHVAGHALRGGAQQPGALRTGGVLGAASLPPCLRRAG